MAFRPEFPTSYPVPKILKGAWTSEPRLRTTNYSLIRVNRIDSQDHPAQAPTDSLIRLRRPSRRSMSLQKRISSNSNLQLVAVQSADSTILGMQEMHRSPQSHCSTVFHLILIHPLIARSSVSSVSKDIFVSSYSSHLYC